MNKVKQLVKNGRVFLVAKWKWILALVVVVGLAALYQVNAQRAAKPEYTFASPQRQDLVKTLEVSGVVDAKEKARLRFVAGGKITYLGAQAGQPVKKWQTIARIDPATLNKQLEQDLNNYLLERYTADDYLMDTKDSSLEKEITRTRRTNQIGLENEVLDVEIRDIAIKNTALTAPFAGILTASPTNVTGVQLLSTDFFEVVNPQTLVFRAEVDEADIAQVKLGQAGRLRLDAYLDEEVESNVNYIAYTSNQTTSGTVFLVEFPLISADLSKFRIGMNGDIAIETDRAKDALVIPLSATRERDGKVFVDVKTGEETIAEREITVGLQTDDDVQILSGLSESDQVVIPE